MFTQWQNKWLVLSTASVTTANLQINTKTGGQWLVNWGDGNVDVVNSGVYKTHTYSTAYVGNVLVKPQSGGLNNIDGFSTNVGSWNFDLSVFLKVPNMTNQLYISGNSMAISGNLSSVPSGLTNQLYISGNSMAISGNLSSIPSGLTNQLVFSGALMTITGDIKTSAPLATYYYYYTPLSTISYTSGRVWKNMTNVTFALASSHLTVTEVNNMLVDLDASPLVTGAGTIDLRGNNATPTGAGLTAKSSLIAKGKTVYTN
jgi:hypothetical protein